MTVGNNTGVDTIKLVNIKESNTTVEKTGDEKLVYEYAASNPRTDEKTIALALENAEVGTEFYLRYGKSDEAKYTKLTETSYRTSDGTVVETKPFITGGVQYATLKEAVGYVVSGGTIELLGNVNIENVAICSSVPFTIDLKGKTINAGGYGLDFLTNSAVVLNNGVINGNISVGAQSDFSLTINDLKHKGSFTVDAANAENVNINSGLFTANVSKYCADGKTVVDGREGYGYEVKEVIKAPETATAKAETVVPKVEVNLSEGTLGNVAGTGTAETVAGYTSKVENAVNTTETNDALHGAATTLVTNEDVVGTTEAAEEKLAEAGIDVGSEANVTVVVRPYIDIKAKEVVETKSVTFEIKAKYDTVATTDADNVVIGTNAAVIESDKILPMEGKEIGIKLPVPTSVATHGDDVYIKHTKSTGEVFFYADVVDVTNHVTFTHSNGFSEFEVFVNPVAKIGAIGYDSLQSAIDAANAGDLIDVLVSDASKTFDVTTDDFGAFSLQNSTGDAVTVNITAAKDGKEFDKWSDEDTDNPRSFNIADTASVSVPVPVFKTPSQPITGGAGAATNNILVKFDTKGGSEIDTIRIAANRTVKEPKAPTKAGYTFAGWYSDEELITKFDFATKITKSITLYAKWVEENAEDKPVEEAPEVKSEYSDVANDAWYAEYVAFVTENGLMNGVEDGKFAPADLLTRGMLATIIYRYADGEVTTAEVNFNDIDGHWAADAVKWAASNGVVSGYDNGDFGVDDNITREQIAVMLYRYASSPETSGDVSVFTDADSISDYAETAIKWAVENGLLSGKGNGILDPKGNATRGEAAKMIATFVGLNK